MCYHWFRMARTAGPKLVSGSAPPPRTARGLPAVSTRASRFVLAAVLAVIGSGCVVVPQNRRRYLADPTMQSVDDPLEARARDKLHTTREAASGGNGAPAGGGCACGN